MRRRILWMSMIFVVLVAIVAAVFGVRIIRRNLVASQTLTSESVKNGNTGGNLYNGGMFCECDGIVYFANPNDNYRLYTMNAFGGEQTKLCDDSVGYINVDENYVYYTRRSDGSNKSNGFLTFAQLGRYALCRIDKNGKHKTILDSDPSLYACLVGDYIYYVHYDSEDASTMYRVGINGKDKEKVFDERSLTCSAYGSTLYFNGTLQDHNIYALDASTNQVTEIYSGNAWQPIYVDGYLYFMNLNDNYSLVRVNMSSMEATTVVTEKVQNYNVYGNTIYYVNTTGDVGLYRCNTDGSNVELVKAGNVCDINITSSYVYFRLYEEEDIYYCTPTNSAVNVTTFIPVMGT